ncbi:MAG TPA: protein kinase [Polyangia bacterium]|jgi:serine/threonine-protein kinase|nr:protein kinase [Polyangia bacterium]
MVKPKRRSGRTVSTILQSPGKEVTFVRIRDKEISAGFGPERLLVDEGEIGAGGSGSVHRAYDPNLRRVVAMKVMAPRGKKNVERRSRFINEARIMAQLDHPNVVPVHDLVADHRKNAYFVMKLVRGRTLEAVVGERGAQPASPDGLHRLLLILLKVCDALAFAHSRGVLHCDLKPDNIMVGEYGEVYLMDWGIAFQKPPVAANPDSGAHPGIRGTPSFMSPEQAQGDGARLTEKTDVFGLGAVLYFILTGHKPFAGKSVTQILARARAGEYQDPELAAGGPLPPSLVHIVRRAMSRDPEDRYASVLEVSRSVEEFARGDWHLPVRTFPRGSIIAKEGEWADAAYIIVSGACRVFKTIGGERRLLRTMGPGDVFGETGILSGDVRTATVETVDEVVARVVTRELFQDQLGVDSWLAKFVLALADRFRDLDQRLARQKDKSGA